MLFIYSSTHGPLRCFHLLAIKSNAAMNMHVQFLFEPVFNLGGAYTYK